MTTGPRGDMGPDVGTLGKKIDYPAPEAPEWVPVKSESGSKHIERNTKTGRLRNVEPPPYANQWGWVYVPPIPVPEATEITPASFRQMLKDAEIEAGHEVQVGMAFSPDGFAWLLQPKEG